jgi:hypothetical protein
MALPVDVRLDSGTALNGYTVSVNRTDDGNGFFDLSVVVQAMDLSLFNDFDLFWGTGDCGNDTIWGAVNTASPLESPVPAPPALSLLGIGLFGLWILRRRPDHGGNLIRAASGFA